MMTMLEQETQETEAMEHREGPLAKAIEKQTAKLPSDVFLWGALAAIAVSAGLQLTRRTQLATFVGEWAPTILLLGLYNKVVKVAGSDRVGDLDGGLREPTLH